MVLLLDSPHLRTGSASPKAGSKEGRLLLVAGAAKAFELSSVAAAQDKEGDWLGFSSIIRLSVP